ILDERQVAHPYLVEELPKLGTDSWRLLPDGRMETLYRLRAGLTWQAGTARSGEDVVFAWHVYATPSFGVDIIPPLTQIEEVSAPDPGLVVFRWRQPYPGAGTLVAADFQPV